MKKYIFNYGNLFVITLFFIAFLSSMIVSLIAHAFNFSISPFTNFLVIVFLGGIIGAFSILMFPDKAQHLFQKVISEK